MPTVEEKSGRELTSWKEIADFLEVSVRTAQRYELELGLPVRRLAGEKGRAVAANVDALVAWKRKHVTTGQWWQNPKFLRWYAFASTFLVIILAAYVIRDLATRFSVGRPHDSYWLASTLVVTDERGRTVWRRSFDKGPIFDGVSGRYHGDLDRDGTIESVVPHVTAARDTKGGFLYCYSQKGQELWRIQPKRTVSDRTTQFSHLYVLRSYTVFASPEKDGTRWVAAAFVHHYDYPSVAIVVDSKGKRRGEYWHSGHLESVYTMDLDGDGTEEILLAGTDRAAHRATLVVFDAKKVRGGQVLPPGHPNQLLGFPAGTEKAIVLFERSRLNKLRDSFNYAYSVGPNTNSEDRSFQVTVSECLTRDEGYLIYTIRPDLAISSVVPSTSLVNTYLEYSLKDPTSKALGQSDLEDLRRGYEVKWRTP